MTAETTETITTTVSTSPAAMHQIGRSFTSGVITELATVLIIGFVILVVLQAVLNWLDYGTDSSDKSGTQRSGVAVRIDHGTGCEYLETSKGALTPRLDAEGRHICRQSNR